MPGARADREDRQGGQATPEYVAMVLLVALVLTVGVAIAGATPAGRGIARAVADKLLCGVGVSDRCGARGVAFANSPIEAHYGGEIAALLDRHAPDIFFEGDSFVSLPVDFRECRQRACSDTVRPGVVHATQTGLPPAAFTHVVDCRGETASSASYECAGERAGRLYLQYWLYYPESLTHGLGRFGGFHEDDWESFQVRVDGDGTTMARASSHHGYNGGSGGIGSLGSDTGWRPRPGWDTSLNTLHVASGSHAGTTEAAFGDIRAIGREDLLLIPAEPIAAVSEERFAVSPPWRKAVWRDPESMGTGTS